MTMTKAHAVATGSLSDGLTPVFAICGYSGAGKTTLVLHLLGRLRGRGLSVLVVKHDAHGLDFDRPGKDTDRLFRAGADVLAREASQGFLRSGGDAAGPLAEELLRLAAGYDVILVEGYKAAPIPRKLWLRRNARDLAPPEVRPVALDLDRDCDRPNLAWQWLERELAAFHASRPTCAGLLLGGRSSRMGQPKHLLLHRGRTWLARLASAAAPLVDDVVLLGNGRVPRSHKGLTRLPDAPGRVGPIAGMCAAMRWNPSARWLFLSCDMPLLDARALRWLCEQARPGLWAIQPRLAARAEPQPFPGWYDGRVAGLLERALGPSWLARHPRTSAPLAPPEIARTMIGCNTPDERRRLLEAQPSPAAGPSLNTGRGRPSGRRTTR